MKPVAISRPAPTRQSKPLSIPLTFEANVGQAPTEVAFLARGPHLTTLLTRTGIEVEPAGSRNNPAMHHRIQITFARASRSSDEISELVPVLDSVIAFFRLRRWRKLPNNRNFQAARGRESLRLNFNL
jgi:hypothetical protein